jgi:hypothetical protein
LNAPTACWAPSTPLAGSNDATNVTLPESDMEASRRNFRYSSACSWPPASRTKCSNAETSEALFAPTARVSIVPEPSLCRRFTAMP